jgi:hypothetical protein
MVLLVVARLLNVTVTAGATTGTVSVRTTTADTIDEVDETLALLMELFRLRVQLSTITMRTVTISPASATEGSDVCLRQQPFCSRYFVCFFLTNGTAGSAITRYKCCRNGSSLELYRYQQLRIQLMKWMKL